MKQLALGFVALLLVTAAVAWSGQKGPVPEFEFRKEDRNPVSHFRFNSDPESFQFAVVSDRTGGHRGKIFSRAVQQLNLMQPEFVVSVGDLIEGYKNDKERLAKEWREFQGYVTELRMPFFYLPGNHDLANPTEEAVWKEKFGRRYYDFVYKNVLFLMLCTEDPPGKPGGQLSPEQLQFLKKSLETHQNVCWTLVFLHKPMWSQPNLQQNNWLEAENLLKGRAYTVFAGHVHRYQKFVRNGQNYYQLATTGGESKVRGIDYGEFDHIVWVTMKKEGPVLANITLDGILPEDLRKIETDEEGITEYNRKPTQPVRGLLRFEGKPVAGAQVVLQALAKDPNAPRADAITGADGTFNLSTYVANDGAPAGEYTVTITWRVPRFDLTGKPGPNRLPEKYARTDVSNLRANIRSGQNDLKFDLEK